MQSSPEQASSAPSGSTPCGKETTRGQANGMRNAGVDLTTHVSPLDSTYFPFGFGCQEAQS